MKLRTKLILYVSALLATYVVIIFFVPTFVVVRDIEKVGQQIHDLIIKKHRRLLRDQEVLVEEIFQQMRASIDACLIYVLDSNHFANKLQLLKSKDYGAVWNAAANIASHSPNVGFVQVSQPGNDLAVVLKPSEAEIYKANSAALREHFVALEVVVDSHTHEKKLYLGIELPKNVQTEEESTFYALLNWKRATQENKELQTELAQVKEKLAADRHRLDATQIFNAPENARAAAQSWIYKMEMIKILTPLVIEGIELGFSKPWVPQGVARVKKDDTAEVVLSSELIATRAIFSAADAYKKHMPPQSAPPIAAGDFFVYDHSLKHIYIANVLDLDGVYLTVGTSADRVARDFAIWSGKPVLVSVDQELWMGFDGSGERYTPGELNRFAERGLLHQESGVFEYNNHQFFFANIAQFEGGRIGIFELAQLDGKDSIASLSLKVASKLAWKISFQIFVLSLFLIIIVIFLLSRLVMYLAVKPILKLADITDQVVSGQYTDISWPKMGKRSDEVAKLTHSFEEMVHGLEEKEKIRGVLDKVVSKDVANEILKSQIHLGGEDRNVSVLFSDIRDFTKITERLSPRETIELLNSCMTKITQVIEGEGGVIDKFVGDAVMAIYGAPTKVEDHALRAVSSALLIVRAIKNWNDERESRGMERVEMGIGVNTGLVVAGNMGAVDRLNYTVLGKNVNVAARLCSIAKPAQLIISEQTLNEPHVKDSFYVETLPSVMLKGFSEPFRIYHVIDFKWEQS